MLGRPRVEPDVAVDIEEEVAVGERGQGGAVQRVLEEGGQRGGGGGSIMMCMVQATRNTMRISTRNLRTRSIFMAGAANKLPGEGGEAAGSVWSALAEKARAGVGLPAPPPGLRLSPFGSGSERSSQ